LEEKSAPNDYPLPEELPESPVAPYASSPAQIVSAAMVGGNWIGLPWFVFNAFALEGPTKRRELIFAALLPIATMVLGMGLIWVVVNYRLPFRVAEYGIILVFVAKLGLLYQLERLQSVTLKIHRAIGRKTMDGIVFLIAAFALRGVVIPWAFGISPWLGFAAL